MTDEKTIKQIQREAREFVVQNKNELTKFFQKKAIEYKACSFNPETKELEEQAK